MNKFIVYLCVLASLIILSGCGKIYSTASNIFSGSIYNPKPDKVVTLYVIGKGLEPENALTRGQAVIMAERAAVADGHRQLAEKVKGIYVDAYMKAGNGVADYNTIQLHTQAWLRGSEIVELKQGEYNITEARMRLRINFSKKGMVWWPIGINNSDSKNVPI